MSSMHQGYAREKSDDPWWADGERKTVFEGGDGRTEVLWKKGVPHTPSFPFSFRRNGGLIAHSLVS